MKNDSLNAKSSVIKKSDSNALQIHKILKMMILPLLFPKTESTSLTILIVYLNQTPQPSTTIASNLDLPMHETHAQSAKSGT